MKHAGITFLLTFIAGNFVFAQNPKEAFTVNVTKVTFIEPGIAHELPLGRTSSFFMRGGLTATLAENFYGGNSFLVRPFVSSSLRAYYNSEKRKLKELNIANNSANYFALLLIVATSPINKTEDYDPGHNEALFNSGLVWGMQRNYPSGFSLDLNIGAGYLKGGTSKGFGPVAELNIGWVIGKKH